MARGRLDDVHPEDARLHPGDPARGIDPHTLHPVGPDQNRVLQRGERCRVVSGALRGDALALLAGEQHSGRDVAGGVREDHRRGTLIDGEVPGPAGLIVARVRRAHDLPFEVQGETARPANGGS
jgi:hypothetical protein